MAKLTLGVNFINTLRKKIVYESALRSFSLVKFLLCNFLVPKYWREKIVCKMLMKLTTVVDPIKFCVSLFSLLSLLLMKNT